MAYWKHILRRMTITTLFSVYDGIEATYLFDDFQLMNLSNDEVYLAIL